MYKIIPKNLSETLDQNRLLIISPSNIRTSRVTKETASLRNQSIVEISDELTIAYAMPGGSIERLVKGLGKLNQPPIIKYIDKSYIL